jgi:hypothetical protein
MHGRVPHEESPDCIGDSGHSLSGTNPRQHQVAAVHSAGVQPAQRAENEELQPAAIEVTARMPTLVEAALADYSKQVIIKSLDNAIDFHKTMLGVSATFGTLTTTLIPILSWGSKDASIPLPEGWFLLAPPGLMLASAVCFALGYFPRSEQLNANLLEDITRFRAKALAARRRLAKFGLAFFCCSILLTVILTTIIRAGAVI